MSLLKDSEGASGVLRTGRMVLLPWQMVLLLSLYVGVVLNGAVLARRLVELGKLGAPTAPGALMTLLTELGLVFAFTALLLSLADLSGKWVSRIVMTLLLTISVLASYYMTFFNVVIGYGVVQAVLTTDVDLSKEAVGTGLLLWFISLAVVPLALWWRYVHVRRQPVSSWKVRVQQLGGKAGWVLLFAATFAVLAQRVNSDPGAADAVGQDIGQASLAAHTYVPSNWVAGLGMSASSAWDGWVSRDEKSDPAKQFQYSQSAAMDDVVVVVVIGESARSGNFGLLGYDRPTTPFLATEKNLVAFKGTACNTSTKLSLQCMFVRPQGVKDRGLQAPQILEETVFSVLTKLGFSVELFAMQSEVWFYNSLKSDFYKIREVIAADPANRGKPVLDALLESELSASIAKHPKSRQAIVLHTKGSHFSYTSRYPREFARYQPECSGVDGACSKAQLINSYDNSVLYTDTFLHQVMKSLADKKAILIYTSDHGESIDENRHFHATPKPLAPPEQLAVPLLFWASDPYLNASPIQKKAFEQLQIAAKSPNITAGHANLFDSMLGCLGISSSNGGVNPQFNLCN
ncbi:MAG: kdo(2)-lipid A phosphoethanolamine 7''-transferase [Burkholderiaceae bacterium]|nr:kdo(2)-lipid A phosphoethanolamine 7''-transferase [Burkholderiaceae bacterium]